MKGAAVVTGAARGIGRAVAERLLAADHAVALIDVDGDSLARTARELGRTGAILAQQCDVSDPAAIEEAFDRIRDALGEISVLVNNAGVGGPFHRIDEVTDAEWDWVFNTNVKSVFATCRAALPAMKRAGFGRVVNIASVQGLLGAAGSSSYVASKHAVVGYTRALAAEWGAHGVTCNAVCPGYVDTRMGIPENATAADREQIVRDIPAGRVATTREIAAAVEHLVHPDSGYVNGACVVVDGGLSSTL